MSTTDTGAATTEQTTKKTRKTTFTKALNDALDLGMERFDEMFLIGEDIGEMGGDFGVTKKLWAKYGAERVRDTPLSEAAIIGTCVGSAMVGMRPVAEIMFADFLGECYDQIVNNAAKVHYMFDGQFTAPLVIRTACGGGFGGGPHHSQSVEGWFLNIPGIVIVAPSNPVDAKGLLLASIESDDPVLFLEHKALYRARAEVPDGYYTTPLGRAAVARDGTDITVVATMRMVPMALAAAEQVAADGISVEVVDLRTIRPYDAETILTSVAKTRQGCRRQRGPEDRRVGSRTQRPDPRGVLQRPACPRRSRRRSRLADPILGSARAHDPAGRERHRHSDPPHHESGIVSTLTPAQTIHQKGSNTR